jgi:predicted lipoprotein with Yx(FWY)xxD motif
MNTNVFSLLLALAAGSTAPPATTLDETTPPIRKLDGVLVDEKGRGLYTYAGDDEPGRSKCNRQCRLLWPPLMATANSRPKGPFTLARRDDGTLQWALRGKPLYRWASDKKFGDHGGNGVSDDWVLVTVGKPASAVPTPYHPEVKP